MPKAVGFDFDHTLGMDNKLERIAFLEVVHEIAARSRGAIDGTAAGAIIDRELGLFRAGHSGLSDALARAFATILGGQVPAEAEHMFRERAVRLVPQYVVALPGVPQFLAELDRSGLPYAILTNGWNPLQQEKADCIGFRRPVLVSEDLGVRKPEPEAFSIFAGLFNSEPGDIIYVGDDPLVDIVGALRAGMQAIWFQWEDRTYPPDVPPPTAIVHRIGDVLNYLS